MKLQRLIPILLPTNEVSEIFKFNDKLVYGPYDTSDMSALTGFINQHLYLCSQESIKKGDWCLCDEESSIPVKADKLLLEILRQGTGVDHYKIIATNDPKLIADGVSKLPELILIRNPNHYNYKDEYAEIIGVSLLIEFCKRYNEQNNIPFDRTKTCKCGKKRRNKDVSLDRCLICNKMIGQNKAEQKEVDVKKLAETKELAKKMCIAYSKDRGDKFEMIQAQIDYEVGFLNGHFQALQSQTEYSLEDMRNLYKYCNERNPILHISFEDYIQSLIPKSISTNKEKGIEMYCEMEENQCDGCKDGVPIEEGNLHRMGKGSYPDFMGCTKEKYNKIKLNSNKEPIIYFK